MPRVEHRLPRGRRLSADQDRIKELAGETERIDTAMMPHIRSHPFCAILKEAKATFAETWRAWLTLTKR
jgi:hypothetical protein